MAYQKTNEKAGMILHGAASKPKCMKDIIGKEWYFWTNHGSSFMGPGVTNPVLATNVGEWSKFRIIPVNFDPNHNDTIAKIAIEHTSKNGKKTYISCRRKCLLTNSCLAEYRATDRKSTR